MENANGAVERFPKPLGTLVDLAMPLSTTLVRFASVGKLRAIARTLTWLFTGTVIDARCGK